MDNPWPVRRERRLLNSGFEEVRRKHAHKRRTCHTQKAVPLRGKAETRSARTYEKRLQLLQRVVQVATVGEIHAG